MKNISRTVVILSLVSFFTDVASEMLYPVMPIYLGSIGFSIVLIGVLEGFAEAIAGLSKGYFGKMSDINGKRLPFIQWGYALSAISKPMMGAFVYPLWIFLARTLDRFGKGIRTGARDAMLSDETTKKNKAKVFGFHRTMDTFGAVVGPLSALLYLYFRPGDYRTLFFIAFAPGVLALVSTIILKEKKKPDHSATEKVKLVDFISYFKKGPVMYRKLLAGLLLFALFNSSDVFLLLKAKESGMNDTYIIGMYILYNLMYALLALPMGILADRIGLKKIYLLGLLLFAIAYFSVAFASSTAAIIGIFLLYGAFSAATEGISKAWISNICETKDTATAIGTFAGMQSICTMLASSICGLIWWKFGSSATFIVTGSVTLIVLIYILWHVHEKSPTEASESMPS
jgi:MFS family permease